MKMATVWYYEKIHACHLNIVGILFISLLLIICSISYAAGEHEHNGFAGTDQMQLANTYCPVMTDMQTNPEIFTEYKGKRVYFCCKNCKAAFGSEPEKYLDRLPQFGGTVVRKEQRREHRLELSRLIKPMGIITLSLLVLTASGRLFRAKVPKFLVTQHKRLGIITVISALVHATLVLIAH